MSSSESDRATNNTSGNKDTTDNADNTGSGDNVKDKFREALERKRGIHADREAAADRLDGSKVHSERAAAKTKRTFRRKSG
jgi:hypothetical protein